MCITAHFIGHDWKLHKKVISFSRITSHKGSDIGAGIARCLNEWGLKRLFTVTVDNASANDSAIKYLHGKLHGWGTQFLSGNYLQVRCVCHIINLIVQDGLNKIGMSVRRVREAVRWVRASPAREECFRNAVAIRKMKCKKMPLLDVPTRWNSTFSMLDTASAYEKAFKVLENMESNFVEDLGAKTYQGEVIGVPSSSDWDSVRVLSSHLKFFSDMTRVASGTSYVTINLFLKEVTKLFYHIKKMKRDEETVISTMASSMEEKVKKYWSEDVANVKVNRLVYIGAILDPRKKMEIIPYSFKLIYDPTQCAELVEMVRSELHALFDLYKAEYEKRVNISQSGYVASSSQTTGVNGGDGGDEDDFEEDQEIEDDCFAAFDDDNHTGDDPRAELVKYLAEAREVSSSDKKQRFDVLAYWKASALRFPILSEMARDVLAVPISSVASESAFSTGGRVLSNFRSSLTSAIVEALICAEDWLRSTSPDIFDPEEEENENEQLEFEKGNLWHLYCLSSIDRSLSSIYHLYSYRVLFCLGFEETVLKFDATPPAIGSDPLVQPVLQSFINKNGNDNAIVDSDDDDNEYNEDDALENEMFGMAGASDDD
ncbi:Zinc finger BED domain-containing protein RICESLEEPER 2 [Linum perenne]